MALTEFPRKVLIRLCGNSIKKILSTPFRDPEMYVIFV